jgi:hypothetical protein
MATYVVATRREAQGSPLLAEKHVREAPSVRITGSSNPNCITIVARDGLVPRLTAGLGACF